MKKKYLKIAEVKKLAKLTKLSVSDKEIEKLRQDLGETVDYINNINELDKQIKEMRKKNLIPTYINQTFSDGKANRRHLTKTKVFSNSKNESGPYFAVEKVQ